MSLKKKFYHLTDSLQLNSHTHTTLISCHQLVKWVAMKKWAVCCLFVCLVGFFTSSSTTRLYSGLVPRLRSDNFTCWESGETMTSVPAGHIIRTATQPVGSGRPQRGSHPGPPHQVTCALYRLSYRAPLYAADPLKRKCTFNGFRMKLDQISKIIVGRTRLEKLFLCTCLGLNFRQDTGLYCITDYTRF